jgi:dynein heavy chain 2
MYFFFFLFSIGGMNKSEGKDNETASPTEILGGRLWRMSEEELTKLISQGLVYYEREEKDLNMLLFPEILENITHIDRTISTHKGHLLLVGRAGESIHICYTILWISISFIYFIIICKSIVTGVGRRNCITIVSYMLGYEFYTPAISRDYQMKQFFVDVKVRV